MSFGMLLIIVALIGAVLLFVNWISNIDIDIPVEPIPIVLHEWNQEKAFNVSTHGLTIVPHDHRYYVLREHGRLVGGYTDIYYYPDSESYLGFFGSGDAEEIYYGEN